MKDPLDNQTLCLIEAATRPLTNAERQKRRREKIARERAAGRRIPLGDVSLGELQIIKALVGAHPMEGDSERAQCLRALWQRLVDAELSAHGLKTRPAGKAK
jgi:hypothetical protein